jgi:hypothetical protein
VRTTPTIDQDLADALRRKAHRSRKPAPPRRRYRLKPVSLGGVASGIDADRILRLADVLESDAIARKIDFSRSPGVRHVNPLL